jgi:hypothetical protein
MEIRKIDPWMVGTLMLEPANDQLQSSGSPTCWAIFVQAVSHFYRSVTPEMLTKREKLIFADFNLRLVEKTCHV